MSLHEDKLHKAIVEGFKELLNDKEELLSLMQECLNVTDRNKNGFVSVYSLEARIKEINQSMIDLVNLAVKSGNDETKYETQLIQLKDEKQRLQSILEAEKEKKQNSTKPETVFFLKSDYKEIYHKIRNDEIKNKELLIEFEKEYPGVIEEQNIDNILKNAEMKMDEEESNPEQLM